MIAVLVFDILAVRYAYRKFYILSISSKRKTRELLISVYQFNVCKVKNSI